ncbi:MAG: 3-isopropylmalate dehydratase [Bacteroidetes bacterium]|nr:MAG: 3-isopropylmalate dehydratase [Bacteroidota bacterium]
MKPIITGRAFVLGNDIDTDQIIPAAHLVYKLDDPEERKNYGRYALSGVPAAQSGLPQGNVPFVRDGEWRSGYTIIVAGKNFGCGSSREHAPFALQVAGIEAVVAESYARIFYRNAIDGAFVAPYETPDRLAQEVRTGDELTLDTAAGTLTNRTQGKEYRLNSLGDVEHILRAGGIFEYARTSGMLQKR